MKKELKLEIEKAKLKITEEVEDEIERKLAEYEKKIDKLNASIDASIFHLQANAQIEKGDKIEGFSDYITAAHGYLICEDYINLQRILNSLLDLLSDFSLE